MSYNKDENLKGYHPLALSCAFLTSVKWGIKSHFSTVYNGTAF